MAAIVFGVLGSIAPAWGIWLALGDFAAWGQWKPFHTIMLMASLLIELPVLITVGALLLKKKRMALWTGGFSIVLSLSAVEIVRMFASGIAGGWH